MPRLWTPRERQVGDKLGPKIALLVKQVMTDHLREAGHLRAKIGTQAAVDFWKTVAEERDQHWQPMLERLTAHEDAPEWHKQAMHFVRHGHGEAAAMAALSVAQGAATQTIMQVLNAELAPVIHAQLSKLRTFLLDPQTAAALAAHRIVGPAVAIDEAAGSGYSGQRTEWLIEANEVWPDLQDALELWRRGKVTDQQVIEALRRSGMREEWIAPLMYLKEIPLLPADLALMVLKGIITNTEAEEEAELTGVNKERLHRIILATGEPISLQELQSAYRRGFIDEKRLEHGVRQSRVRNEWMDVILKLRFAPASPSDALKAVIQGHLPSAEGKKIAEQNGLEPSNWEWLVETEGNPISPMEAMQLWRRGVIGRKTVEQAIREGRTKDKYIPAFTHLRKQLPSLYQVNNLLKTGSLTPKLAATILHELGYEPDVVKAIVHSGTVGTATKVKEQAKSEIGVLYYEHAIDEKKALELLALAGYQGHVAHLVLSTIDISRERALQQAAMSPIKTAYIDRLIEAEQAKSRLGQLGLPHKQIDFAMRMWTVDREAHTKTLSEAQVVKANKEGLIDDAAAEKRLEKLGYSHDDARLLLDMEKGRTTPAP